jgi:hypothetical protein
VAVVIKIFIGQRRSIVKMKEIIREKDEVNLVFEYLESNLLEYY